MNKEEGSTDLTAATYERAVQVLRRNATQKGLQTSHAYYHQIWSRDAFISFMGANMIRDDSLLKSARATIDTFARTRSPLGQIASFYEPSTDSPEFGFSGSTDSSCWFILALGSLYHALRDESLLEEPLAAAIDAYRFVRYQDANNSWLIDSPLGADWMDAAIQRTGKTLYNNILFLAATKCLTRLVSTAGISEQFSLLNYESLKERFTDVFLPNEESIERISRYWPRLATHHREQKLVDLSRKFYLQYISFARIDSRFDTLSNLLCILFGAAERESANSIIETIKARELARPFPVRNLDPPYEKGGLSYDDRFDAMLPIQHRSGEYDYHNGGVWPFVGGFLVCALYYLGMGDATDELVALAHADGVCRDGESVGFNEWLDGKKGEARGQYGQSWSAGMYIAAYLSSQGKDPFEFLR
ncbi:MAG TPA: amylo-alpha-1,6-glucosidase [Nitrososphaerales archaeon]|nr:amylo-alpha-1,6-glucosidase [Nitrososphaerales archaeon]